MARAYENGEVVKLLLFDPFEDEEVEGDICKVDVEARNLMLGDRGITMKEIIDVR